MTSSEGKPPAASAKVEAIGDGHGVTLFDAEKSSSGDLHVQRRDGSATSRNCPSGDSCAALRRSWHPGMSWTRREEIARLKRTMVGSEEGCKRGLGRLWKGKMRPRDGLHHRSRTEWRRGVRHLDAREPHLSDKDSAPKLISWCLVDPRTDPASEVHP